MSSYIDRLLQEIENLKSDQPEPAHAGAPTLQNGINIPPERPSEDLPRNPLMEDGPWFAHMKTSGTPIWIGEASDAAFATRFRQTMAVTDDFANHIPRTHYATEDLLLKMAKSTPQWPSLSRARLLVGAAMRSLCRCYHIVRKSEVLALLERLDHNRSNPKEASYVCKMWAIFAIGELYTTKIGSLDDDFPGLAYFAHANNMLRVIGERPQLDSVETMLLLSLYSLELNRRHSAYTLVGSSVRLATVMGLHFNIDKVHIPDPELREHRNRVWWTAYVFDRMWSSKIGLPASISDDDISVELPSKMEGTNADDFVDHEYLIASIELARLAGRINCGIYGRKAQTGQFLASVQDLLKSLQEWAQRLPAHLRIDTDEPAKDVGRPVSLHLSFNQCLILATRPLLLHMLRIRLRQPQAGSETISTPGVIEAIATTCVRCARHSCALLTDCWINGTFHIFDYFYTQYLFSAATVLAISGLLEWDGSTSDDDGFETATGFLVQLQRNGNNAAKEFCSHIEGIKGSILALRASASNGPAQSARNDLLDKQDTSHTASAVGLMTAETALEEPSLQQFLSEEDLGIELFDPQWLSEDTQGIFGYQDDLAYTSPGFFWNHRPAIITSSPCWRKSSASFPVFIPPTADTAIASPTAALISRAKGAWYPGPDLMPEACKVSTPFWAKRRASLLVSGTVQLSGNLSFMFSNQSVALTRTNRGISFGIAALTSSATSRTSRVRFSQLPPYESVLADRAEKLVQQIAVRGVDLDHVETGLDCALRRINEGSLERLNVLQGHCFGCDIFFVERQRRRRVELVGPAVKFGPGECAAMEPRRNRAGFASRMG
ncbi:LOW QUALITY PROTEIN: putative transcriptional regulatory protein [Paramyrothecium foliicola]|nr:LOW QUALITY PROTEIN: putative transcriptional regulatory protein [Paramyrothecium foliicola]